MSSCTVASIVEDSSVPGRNVVSIGTYLLMFRGTQKM